MSNWLSAAESSLKLLDRNECYINLILANLNFKLDRRRNVGYLSFLYKILYNSNHPLYTKIPDHFIQKRV